MARAGRCEQCGTTVWLREDGSCVSGHPASGITGVYEVDPTPWIEPLEMQAAARSKRTRRTITVVAVVAVVIAGCAGVAGLVGMLVRDAITSISSPIIYPDGTYGWEEPGDSRGSDEDWAALLSCPASGTVIFAGELDSADLETEWGLPVVYVRTEATAPGSEGREVVVAVKIPMDVECTDESGASIKRYDLLARLEELPRVEVEVERISGDAWATRVKLLE